MRPKLTLTIGSLIAAALIAPQASAEGPLRKMMMKRMMERAQEKQKQNPPPPAPAEQTIAYGKDPAQMLDFSRAQGAATPAPLVLFVHGGGWSRGSKDNAVGGWKAPHYTGLGYHFASIDYRLVPAAKVEDQAADVAAALAKLIAQADALGIDRSRIVLMGHSAGAHLVALVGTDESYLRGAGLSFADVAGIIPNDGAAYDVPKQMEQSGRFMAERYDQAFGKDPARQRALSPVFHAASPNAPRFLLLHVQREDGVSQAKELEAALAKSGTKVERREFEGKGLTGHAEINRSLGDPKYAATPVVDAWLKASFGR
jgi:acetyl esterase/lipase